ncbi:MAG: sortase [Patescibacteria group bacterium]
MKKFLKYFVIFFAITFAIFNSRFVAAEFKFWLTKKGVDVGLVLNSTLVPVVKTTLPVAEAREFFLEIPAIGAKAPIVLEPSINPDIIFNRLENGVVHYADSALPGEKGTAIILGHSSAYPWYKGKYGSAFALLGKLRPGDEIFINNGNKTLKYKVSESLIFNPFASKDNRLAALEKTDGSSIILVSCWPVGTAYKRIAVRADLL